MSTPADDMIGQILDLIDEKRDEGYLHEQITVKLNKKTHTTLRDEFFSWNHFNNERVKDEPNKICGCSMSVVNDGPDIEVTVDHN